MNKIEWPVLLGGAIRKREAVIAADPFGMHKYGFPRLALTERQVTELEGQLGKKLPTDYRSFLATCNGWPEFVLSLCLFGREELLGGEIGAAARDRVGDYESCLAERGLTPEDVLVVGSSLYESDLFCVDATGRTLWLEDGRVLDEFDDFSGFFRSMLGYIERLPPVLAEHTEALRREGYEPPH